MDAETTPPTGFSSSTSRRRATRRPAGQDSSAFIVRFWEEPREDDEAPVLRGYIKHLKTGREKYFSSLEEVPRLLGTDLDAPSGELCPSGGAEPPRS